MGFGLHARDQLMAVGTTTCVIVIVKENKLGEDVTIRNIYVRFAKGNTFQILPQRDGGRYLDMINMRGSNQDNLPNQNASLCFEVDQPKHIST